MAFPAKWNGSSLRWQGQTKAIRDSVVDETWNASARRIDHVGVFGAPLNDCIVVRSDYGIAGNQILIQPRTKSRRWRVAFEFKFLKEADLEISAGTEGLEIYWEFWVYLLEGEESLFFREVPRSNVFLDPFDGPTKSVQTTRV